MKFGVTIPNNWGIADPQPVLALGPVAEELGYDSIWVMDHLFNTGYIRERLDDKPYYHPLAVLSYLAATTRRVLLGTSVLVLPYHNPVELAKYTATLDHMSGGRVILGVGVGAMTEEFAALGIPFRQRGALTNECIAIMKELWTNPDPTYHSSRWQFSDLKFSPETIATAPYAVVDWRCQSRSVAPCRHHGGWLASHRHVRRRVQCRAAGSPHLDGRRRP